MRPNIELAENRQKTIMQVTQAYINLTFNLFHMYTEDEIQVWARFVTTTDNEKLSNIIINIRELY